MITDKRIDRVIIALVVIALVGALALVPFVNARGNKKGISMDYEKRLFSLDQIISIDIQMDEANWNDMMVNAAKKKYHSCNVVINGETFKNVGIRTKGGSSLDDVRALKTSDRYSLLIKFNKYVDGQTYHGLDKLALNNNTRDTTAMKDAITYDMCAYLKLSAPLYNYTNISLNGKYFGCYLALEAVGDSFCRRNYGVDYGSLYEPCGMNETDGGNLNYVDDKVSTYSGISDGAKINTGKKSMKRIISALKNVKNGTKIESSVDIDNVLKYMAIQTMAVNLDGFTGYDAHNYFLREKDGQISLIPWDYNLAYGGYIEGDEGEENFDESDWEDYDESNMEEEMLKEEPIPYDNTVEATKVINLPIDTPFTGSLENREFFMKLLSHDAYKAKYYKYLSVLCKKYIQGGELDHTISKIRGMIDDIVWTEANSFFTQAQYKSGVDTLKLLLSKKADSVLGQIHGTIPSTREGQAADTSKLISGEDVILSNMGGLS